jgi:hypothetical protein
VKHSKGNAVAAAKPQAAAFLEVA